MKFINRILSKIYELFYRYRGLIDNFSYLSLLEILKFVLPFVTIPHLIKVLGVEKYGLVAFAQALTMYFSIFVNFGLDISAIRDVSVFRNNKNKLAQIVSSVISIKSVIFLILLLFFTIIVLIVPYFQEHKILYIFSMSICLSEIFCPGWFFQGIERMKYITFIRLISYSVYTILVFVVIKDRSDYYFVPLLLGFGTISGGIFAYYTVLKNEKLRLYIPEKAVLLEYLKESLPFFLSRLSNTINITMSKIMAGFFLGMNEVAILDVSEKIVNAGKIPIQTLSSVVYPYIAINQNKNFVLKMFYLILATGILLCSIVFLFAEPFITILSGSALLDAIPILRLFSIMLIISSITFFLGSPVLVSFGFKKPFNQSSIFGALLLLLLYLIFYYLEMFNISAFIFAALTAEFFIAVYRFYYCVKNELLTFK